jgi:hypothetical protein
MKVLLKSISREAAVFITSPCCLGEGYRTPVASYHTGYTVKKSYRFSRPSRDVTDQTLPGREELN